MRSALHHLLVFLGLFCFWIILSGKLDAFHLVAGGLCAALVTWVSGRLLYSELEEDGPGRQWLSFLPWWRVLLYAPWIGSEIVKANLAMVSFILGPSSRLKPRLLRFNPGLKTEVARFVLGNSITLTPGTLTLDISGGEYLVHALDESSAKSLLDGSIARKVAWCFGEERR
jgi:multicomponent Na+:H+ antiporter subunit E